MSNTQMVLALGALILLSLIIINTSRSTMMTEDVLYDSNFGITATSIASSIIEDASKKRFDHVFYIDSSTVYDANFFTSVGSLGPDSGEVSSDPKTFNDFDDYNDYSTLDTSMAKQTAPFNVECQVNYVSPDDLDNISGSKTFHKKITVRVSSEFMKDTIVMSSIYSYWNFLP